MDMLHEVPSFDYEAAADIRVLIACECSGTVREEFLKLNFDAYSCDLKPDINSSNRHFQCDIREILAEADWDFLAVMHPPCTRLCNSGVRWLTGKDGQPPKKLPKNRTLESLWAELREGAALFSDCWNADIPCIAVENPVMHKYAKELITNYTDQSQTVQPWWFGDPAFKATGLYLKNLPNLVPTDKLVPPRKKEDLELHKQWSQIHLAKPGPERATLRSKTFPGIAQAMAMQWGMHLLYNRQPLTKSA